jgi:hypothetical protein
LSHSEVNKDPVFIQTATRGVSTLRKQGGLSFKVTRKIECAV